VLFSVASLKCDKNFFSVKVVKHTQNRLPSEVVESSSLEILKTWLDTALGNLLQYTLL